MELRIGRLFARRPLGGTQQGRKLAATAYAVRSWKKWAGSSRWSKNSGPRKNFTTKERRAQREGLRLWSAAACCRFPVRPQFSGLRSFFGFSTTKEHEDHNELFAFSAFFRGNSVWRKCAGKIECGHAANRTIARAFDYAGAGTGDAGARSSRRCCRIHDLAAERKSGPLIRTNKPAAVAVNESK